MCGIPCLSQPREHSRHGRCPAALKSGPATKGKRDALSTAERLARGRSCRGKKPTCTFQQEACGPRGELQVIIIGSDEGGKAVE